MANEEKEHLEIAHLRDDRQHVTDAREIERLNAEKQQERSDREIEDLKIERRTIDEERWKAVFGRLDRLQTDVTVIVTKCVVCQSAIETHDAILIGDPHAGTSGLVQKVNRTGDHHAVLYGDAKQGTVGLVQQVDRLDSKIGLVWKGVTGFIGIVIAAYVTYRISKGP